LQYTLYLFSILFFFNTHTLSAEPGYHINATSGSKRPTSNTPYSNYRGSVYSEVWDQVKSDPYEVLPQMKVNAKNFYESTHNKLADSATRTLNDPNDLLPHFNKLLHSNGICLAGTWQITEKTPYTGYYATGSKGLIIARASTAFTNTKRGDLRSFGIAGKIFPTDDRTDKRLLKTANFFTTDNFGGTDKSHFMSTDKPGFSNAPELTFRFSLINLAATTGLTFIKSDSNPMVRDLYPISELELSASSKAKTPKFMELRPQAGQIAEGIDFRNELKMDRHGGKLRFDILVSDTTKKGLRKIGVIEFTESVASESCDHRLHFTHPKAK